MADNTQEPSGPAASPLELPFITLDVFTTTRFKGNPLAVVTIPPNLPSPPTQAQKQAIAREFNLSETVFVHDIDPNDKSNDTTQRKIDIFLTTAEIPFAGHPTIGTAVSLLPLGVRTLVAKAGPIPIAQTGPRAVDVRIPHDVRLHAKRLRDLDTSTTPFDLSSDPILSQAELDSPIFSIVNGMTALQVELPSLDHLSRVTVNLQALPSKQLLDEGWQNGPLSRYYFVRTNNGDNDDDVVKIRTRLVTTRMDEDPATGSAASGLCSYLSLTSGKGDGLTRYEVTQGVEMGRESVMSIGVTVKDGKVENVTLAGTATQVMRGYVSV